MTQDGRWLAAINATDCSRVMVLLYAARIENLGPVDFMVET
jgi:hypothetical protein